MIAIRTAFAQGKLISSGSAVIVSGETFLLPTRQKRPPSSQAWGNIVTLHHPLARNSVAYVCLVTVQLVSVTLQLVWEMSQICDLCSILGIYLTILYIPEYSIVKYMPLSPQLMQFCDLRYVDVQTSGFVGLRTNVFPGLCVHYFCVPFCVC